MSSNPARSEDEIDLRAYLDVIARRWWIIAAVTASALAVALVVSLVTPPVYRAATTVVVDRAGVGFGSFSDITGLSQQAVVETVAEIVRSRAVAERALDQLNVPDGDRQDALRELQSGLRVQRIRGADIIRVEAEGPTPAEAAARANAVAAGLLSWHLEARRSQAAAGRQFVDSQLAIVSRELRAAEDSLARYKTQGGQVALTEQTAVAVEKAAEFEAQHRAIAAEREGVEASLRAAQAELRRLADTVPSSFVTSEDPVAVELRSELAKLEVELAALREQYTDLHPNVTSTQARIDEVKVRLRQHATQRLASETATLNPLHQDLTGQIIRLEVEREALRAKEAALAATVNRYALDLRTLPPKEIELARLTRDLKVAEGTYLLLSQRLQETRIAEASIVGDLRVVDRAVPPEFPVKPRTMLNMVLGALLGFMAGMGLVFVVETLDTTFKGPDEVAETLGLPVLATIPLWKDRRGRQATPHLMTAERQRSPFAEAFRHLRTNLLYISPDRPVRTILVTSPGLGEGKGTIAANLAIALAQLGKRVWLLECDLRRPGLAWTFQPKESFGLTDLLVDGVLAEHAVQATGIENLWFIPSGTKPPNPAELLGSRKMREFLQQERNGVEAVVLDGPPVLPVTDAEVLAPVADGVLLVVRLGSTPRAAARRAKEQLEAVGARVIGVVVNGLPTKRRDGYYSRYYYYEQEDARQSQAKAGQSAHS